jgi:hypothetical protein
MVLASITGNVSRVDVCMAECVVMVMCDVVAASIFYSTSRFLGHLFTTGRARAQVA